MFSLLNSFIKTPSTISFEEVQQAIKQQHKYIFISTMDNDNREPECLIYGSIPPNNEEELINQLINDYEFNKYKIIIYGKNSRDLTANKKAEQLKSLGFSQLYIYNGGFFEWILLQDIYGTELFPTTSKVRDILLYK